MALALLELLDPGPPRTSFRVDLGTNRLHQLSFGREVRHDPSGDVLLREYLRTPLVEVPEPRNDLDSAETVEVETALLGAGPTWVQLYTAKDPGGRGHARSRVVRLPLVAGPTVDLEGRPLAMSTPPSARAPRAVGHRSRRQALVRPQSFEDVLGALVSLAAPVVRDVLGGVAAPSAASAPVGGTDGAAALAGVLRTVLAALGVPVAVPLTPAPAEISRPQSLDGNRFLGQGTALARPFVFGIDDALVASLVGPLVQVLPQLLNSANQQRVQLRQADRAFVGGILSDIQRRLLLDQVLAARRGSMPAPGEPDLAALQALLEGITTATPGAPGPPALAGATSVGEPSAPTSRPSARAVLTPVAGPALDIDERALPLYARNRPITLRWRLEVAAPAPSTAAPRAILDLHVSRSGAGPTLHSTSRRFTDLTAGAELDVALTAADVAALPVGEPLSVVATLRWPAGGGRAAYQATGAAELALVGGSWVARRGGLGVEEREPSDASRHRAFWNKIWEAPSLAAGVDGRPRARRWKLDVVARYTVLLDADPANGIMETRLQRPDPDPDAVVDRTEGRLKAGIELSVDELCRLTALWEGVAVLEPDQVAALRTSIALRAEAGELTRSLRLDGRAGRRGLVWAVPVMRLRETTLATPTATDDTGQVRAAAEVAVGVPVPVAVRLLGLLGVEETDDSGAMGGAPEEYRFEGFTVAFADRVPLVGPGAG